MKGKGPFGFVKLQLVAKDERKLNWGPLEDLKNFRNIKNEIFEQCHSAENVKRGTFSSS